MVMKKLLLKSIRDIKNSKGQFMAIIIVIAIGALISTGLSNISKSLSSYSDKYNKEYNSADLYSYYRNISIDDISIFNKIDGIKRIEGRFTFDASQVKDNTTSDLKIHSIPSHNQINKIVIIDGEKPISKDEILVDSHYAKENNYKIGDKFIVKINDKDFEFKISGLCENVEHAFAVKDNSTIYPNHKLYGFAYISDNKITDIIGEHYYNELIIDIEDNYDVEKIADQIEEKSSNLPYIYQLIKGRTISNSKIDAMVASNKGTAMILPMVFFIVASVIIFTTMSRIVNSQRSQIGIMKALGIKNRNIVLHYIGYSSVLSIIGCLTGAILGTIIFRGIILDTIEKYYSFPDFNAKIDVMTIFINLISASILGAIASYLSGRKILGECAAQAMRPKPPKNSKKIFIERFTTVWNKISFGNKIILRNIFLTKQRTLGTAIGIVVCILLLIVGFGYRISVNDMRMQIDKTYQYDLRVDYNSSIDFTTNKLPSGIKEKYEINEIPVEFIKDNDKKDTLLVVSEKDNTLIVNYDNKENEVALDDTGVIISKSYADKYNLDIGDSVKLKFLLPNLSDKEVEVKITGISVQYLGQSIYCTQTYLESFDIEFNPSTLLLKFEDDKYKDYGYDFLNDDNSVYKVSSKDDLIKIFDDNVTDNYPLMIIFVISAIVFSYSSIYIISSINIFDRTHELATLKVLGYQKGKINNLIFLENIIITMFSIIITLPICNYFYKGFARTLSAASSYTPEKLNLQAVIIAIVITLLVTIISNILLRGKVNKIHMIESLKGVE